MFAATVPVALQALEQADVLLGRASPNMLAARLQPNMFDCATQFRMVADLALRATYPLAGHAVPELSETAPDAVIGQARQAVLLLQPADFTGAAGRRIRHRAGFADLDQSAQDYLQHFAIPNLWFHLSMGFAILRQQGLAVGKADFDGLHSYPAGFAFDN